MATKVYDVEEIELQNGDKVKQNDNYSADQRHFVLEKTPPHQLKIGGDKNFLIPLYFLNKVRLGKGFLFVGPFKPGFLYSLHGDSPQIVYRFR